MDDETGDIRTGGDSGSKRSVSWLLSWLREEHGDAAVDRLWCSIGDICVKTILSILPTLVAEYHSTFGGDATGTTKTTEAGSTSSNGLSGSRCFEVLGFDIMLDEKLQPYLIEVNHLPSFGTDAPLDKAIKSKVIEQAMSVVQAKPDDRRVYEKTQRRKSRHRLVNRLGGGSLLGRRDPYEDDEADENDENDGTHPPMLHLHRPAAPQLPPTAEAILTSIYREHCPEKIDKVPAMLIKYRGYEDWLIAKVRERYCNAVESDGSSNGAPEGSTEKGARHNLGFMGDENGDHVAGMRHWRLSASGGYRISMEALIECFEDGFLYHEDLSETLQAFYRSRSEMKSEDRDHWIKHLKETGEYTDEHDC